MLAGVTNMNVLLDPQGSLFFGSKHVIPFYVTDADIYADVIALCPLPQLLDFTLVTPAGEIINASGGPNVEHVVRPQVAFYRVTLPALAADPAGSHAGKWKAILALKSRAEIDKLLNNREFAAEFENNAIGESLPYSLIAHAYSNLQFEARLQQDSLKPGAVVTLDASLKMYDVPLTDDATVWAEVTRPDLTNRVRTIKADTIRAGMIRVAMPLPVSESMPAPTSRFGSTRGCLQILINKVNRSPPPSHNPSLSMVWLWPRRAKLWAGASRMPRRPVASRVLRALASKSSI